MEIGFAPGERRRGWIYGAVEIFLLPVLAQLVGALWNLETWVLNCGLFALNLVCYCVLLRQFFTENLRAAWAQPGRTLRYAAVGLMLYYIGAMLVGMLILYLRPDYLNLNDQSVSEMAAAGGLWMGFATVICAPIGEELLFRGLIFRGLYDQSPVAAWCLSVGLFAAAHVTGYVGAYDLGTLVLAFLQYVPAGLALAFAYRKSGNILAPMLMHIAINQLSYALIG